MLDWSSRIDDLADLLARQYGIRDRPAIEILLAALVNCPRTASCWLILETNWYSRFCADAWFSFGEQWLPESLPRLRARYPFRVIEAEIAEWVDNPSDQRLFIETDFERFPRFHRVTNARELLQRSLRLRTKTTRTADPLKTLDKYTEDRRTDQLSAAANYVLEDRIHARPYDPPRFLQPPDFLYHVELLQRLAPWYPDWQILVKAFALLGIRRAYLFGRTETDESDHQAMARVLTDSIPPWIARALRILLDGPSQTQTLARHMGLEDKSRRSGHGAHRELVRLRRNEIIWYNKNQGHWALKDEHRNGVRTALDGQTFGCAQPVAPVH